MENSQFNYFDLFTMDEAKTPDSGESDSQALLMAPKRRISYETNSQTTKSTRRERLLTLVKDSSNPDCPERNDDM